MVTMSGMLTAGEMCKSRPLKRGKTALGGLSPDIITWLPLGKLRVVRRASNAVRAERHRTSVVSEEFFSQAWAERRGAAACAAQELPKAAGDGTCSLTRGCIEIDAGVKRCRRQGHVNIAVNRAAEEYKLAIVVNG